jgi:hypothetical protein
VSGTVHTKDTAPGLIMGAGGWLQLQPEGSSYLMDETENHEPGAMQCPLEVVSSPLRRCNSPGNPKGECDIGGAGGGELDRWVHGCR